MRSFLDAALIRLAALAALERRRRKGGGRAGWTPSFALAVIKEKGETTMHIHPEIRRQAIMLRAILAASFLTAAPPVFCDTSVLLTGRVTSSEISGFAGTSLTLGEPEGSRGVYGLWSAERDDKPCQIAAMTEDINDYHQNSDAIKDLCEKNTNSSRISAGFGDIKFARHAFVRSLRVCLSNGNDRLNGFQIRGRVIDGNGNIADLPQRHGSLAGSSSISPLTDLNAPSDQRLHCDSWQEWVECPEGQVAVALTAHFGPGSGSRSVTGIALQCRVVSRDE